ncbi:MAG: hypothetical protein WC785_03710 [Tatlockia sp.]|jgi:hypothetical protein
MLTTPFNFETFNDLTQESAQTLYLSRCFFNEIEAIQTILRDFAIPDKIARKALALSQENTQQTLLHHAAMKGHEALADFLLSTTTINPFLKDHHNKTALDYARESPGLITLFTKHHLLIGVDEITVNGAECDNRIAIGVNIRFSGRKPDCIKGTTSYLRLTESLSITEKKQVDLRLEQYLGVNGFETEQEIAYQDLVRSILEYKNNDRFNKPLINAWLSQKLSYSDKETRLREMKEEYERLARTFMALYEAIDSEEEYGLPPDLIALHEYQDKLFGRARRWAATGTVIGCIPCLGCVKLLHGNTNPLLSVCLLWGAGAYVVSLPFTWIPALYCGVVGAINLCVNGNANKEADKIQKAKEQAEQTIGQLFAERLRTNLSQDFTLYTDAQMSRTQVIEALEALRERINEQIEPFDKTIKQSRQLCFFEPPEKITLDLSTAHDAQENTALLVSS